MRAAGPVRVAVATALVRTAVGLLAVACAGLGHPQVTTPGAVAVTWVSAWIRRDVAAMCQVQTARARGGDPDTCRRRMVAVTGRSDTPWTYGRAGVVRIRRLPAGTAVWVTAPDTAVGGHSFDWVLLLDRQPGPRWRVADYHRVTGPARADPIGHFYGGRS